MALFTVDEEKCLRCGLCVKVCPRTIPIQKAPDQPPAPNPALARDCLVCGHCTAVCPTSALDLKSMPLSSLELIPQGWRISARQFSTFVKARRSIRNYADKMVNKEQLLSLIDSARYAPTARNSQGVEWLVISGREHLRPLAEMVIDWMRTSLQNANNAALGSAYTATIKAWEDGQEVVFRGAPQLIVAHAPRSLVQAAVSALIALSYVELIALSMELATCWAGFFMNALPQCPDLQKALQLPEGNICLGGMMIGYAQHSYKLIPQRNPAHILWQGREL